MHQLRSKAFSCGGSQAWGDRPGKSVVYEEDNTWPWPRGVSCLAKNVLHCECKWKGWAQHRRSYLEHWVTVLSNLACSSLSSCALIWLLFSDKRISGYERMWASFGRGVGQWGTWWCKPSIQKILICALRTPVQTLWCPQHYVARGGLPLSACKPFVNCHIACLSADVRSASLKSHSCESSDPELLLGFFKASVCQNRKFLNLTLYQRKDICFFYY